MIIVTGANGQLGRAIILKLPDKVPAAQLGVSVRDPDQARPLEVRGVRVRRAEYSDRPSLQSAFEGASQVLIISSNSAGEEAVTLHGNAIAAARAAGARRIVYTSHMGSSFGSLFQPMIDHAATEAILQDSGVAFTALRNGFYAASALQLLGNALETGEFQAPADGPVSWTSHADLAEAAVYALTNEVRQVGMGVTQKLTGRHALDLSAVADLASQVARRAIKRVTVSDEVYRKQLVSSGVPEARVELLLGLFAASRKGEFSAVSPALEKLLGRTPQTMREVLAERLSQSRP